MKSVSRKNHGFTRHASALIALVASTHGLRTEFEIQFEVGPRGYFHSAAEFGSGMCECMRNGRPQCTTMSRGLVRYRHCSLQNSLPFNKKIADYAKGGQAEKALEVFQDMKRKHVKPNDFTFLGVLKACLSLKALEEGRRVHAQMTECGFSLNTSVWNSLMDLYIKCGSVGDAEKVFKDMRRRDAVSWTTMIMAYTKVGQGLKALDFFEEMQQEAVKPTLVTFIGVFNACASLAALEQGRTFHELMLGTGIDPSTFVWNSLMDMYTKCGSIDDAWSIFENMPMRDVVSWNVIIAGYVKAGQSQKALDLFQQMEQHCVKPDEVTLISVLNACASLAALEQGRRVHMQVNATKIRLNIHGWNSLLEMYCKCGSIEEAFNVFESMPSKNVISWNAMISLYSASGHGDKAWQLFKEMERQGMKPDDATFMTLNACASTCSNP